MACTAYIGPAGWSYPDWKGIVYPAREKVDQLAFLARMFNTVEINNSFYKPLPPATSRNWIDRVSGTPGFLFTVKLYRRFTHERDRLQPEEEGLFKAGIDPFMDEGKLGALLMQFPYSFHYTKENREALAALLERFRDYPVVVEFRHREWNRPSVLESLSRRNVGFCNVDQPNVSRSLERTGHVTGETAYLRLHGRNAAQWFRDGAGAERYDYLYSEEELKEMAASVEVMRERAHRIFIITNNHLAGQAVANGVQLQMLLTGKAAPVPETLVDRYPILRGPAPRIG